MKKKYLKNLNILNRNMYINFYSNYMIYNYLNNCNLKFFFYFLLKKKYYLKNKKKILIFNKSNIYYKYININKQLFFNNINISLINLKNKFFYEIKPQTSYNFINNKLLFFNNKNNNNLNSNIILNKTINYINLNNKININLDLLYKEIFFILFLLNLIKIFEFYKLLINLIYINIKI